MSRPMSDQTSEDTRTVRERMEALGWFLMVSDDDCSVGWCKVEGTLAVGYQNENVWHDDLARCMAEAEAAGAFPVSDKTRMRGG